MAPGYAPLRCFLLKTELILDFIFVRIHSIPVQTVSLFLDLDCAQGKVRVPAVDGGQG
jgi:hypothetical protein